MSKEIESFLFAANGGFIEDLYLKYLDNPSNVDEYWRNYFANLQENNMQVKQAILGASWLPRKNKIILPPEKSDKKDVAKAVVPAKSDNINQLIAEYRAYGHFLAKLDPLGLEKLRSDFNLKLDPEHYGITEADLDVEINVQDPSLTLEKTTIRQLINKLKEIYCSSVGYEFNHLNPAEKEWLHQAVEHMHNNYALTSVEKSEALKDLVDIDAFEQFVHTRFPGTKRFSIEGGESAILAVNEIIKTATVNNKVEEVIIGMPHRGRLNMLTKVMGKNYAAMLSEFQGNLAHMEELNISGDVKYHLGQSINYVSKEGHQVHLSLTANPSHLEAVDPVVVGKVRAKQDLLKDKDRKKVMGMLMHGDAAFAGQGVVAETLVLGDLEGYSIGGVMHIVVNNQIGFTTLPKHGRASRYPTEIAKSVAAPIIHVNAEDVEALLMVAKIAESYRHQFNKDIVIDVVCFRKYGHNEGDEPMFTQPIMYNAIKNKKSIVETYGEKLISQNIITQSEIDNFRNERTKFFEQKFEESKSYKPSEEDWLKGKWSGLNKESRVIDDSSATGISLKKLQQIGDAIVNYPADMNINSKILRQFEQKKKMLQTGEGIDWSMAEALAYGSLLLEGSNIRLSGQDCKRGTFSHRHAVLFDQVTEKEYVSLNHIADNQGNFEVLNSNLSEYAVLGFEYGYSMIDPNNLILWEGQFGDFSNGAQIIIDQFIASAETKWLRMSGLVMLLPHGYEGQGPEHSSARLERYLQLCAEDNMQVINCSTPANFFHAIRRQIHRKYRKPLIVMSPKSLLRHRLMVSDIKEMLEGTEFRPVIGDVVNKDVRRVILCSGKVYFDLYEEREKRGIKDIALVRIDQYYPFPAKELKAELVKYSNAEIIWCQEEPENMGAWRFIESKIEACLTAKRPQYVGRLEAASPSAGYQKMHIVEQAKLINEALTII